MNKKKEKEKNTQSEMGTLVQISDRTNRERKSQT
jgi:hypothetical protein